MFRAIEVDTEEQLEKLIQKEKPSCKYLYICKYNGLIHLSENGLLKRFGIMASTATDIEEENQYVLDAIQNNPSIEGTLAHQIKEGDTQDNVVTFESNDNIDATSWSDVQVLESGEKHSSIFNKVSTMFKNIRYLYKLLGTTDISAIQNGTVTGAIDYFNSKLSGTTIISYQSNNNSESSEE